MSVTSTLEPPTAYVSVERSQKSGIWILTIQHCPFCGRRHSHGGGDGDIPELGYRLSHCFDHPGGTYELVAERDRS